MHKHEEKTEYKVHDICEACDTLMGWFKNHLSQGCDAVNTHEAGAVVDMIKDLCEAEKDIYKAEYYKTVTKAMEENPMAFAPDFVDDYEHSDRAGYDHWRYKSGKFAPTGHGHRSGFVDTSMPRMDEVERDLKHGVAYRDYENQRRYYSETHDVKDKQKMDEHAKEHILDTAETISEIYRAADPTLKQEIKTELQRLVAQMV